MQREPDMDSAAYRDKKLYEKYKQINNPKKPTESDLLGESGEFGLQDPEQEDLSQQVNYSTMEESYARERRPGFDREMEAIGKANRAGNLTDQERIEAHKRAKRIRDAEDEIDPETGWPMHIVKGAGWLLNKVGEGFDWVDKQAGIPGTDIDVYHARRKILDPLSETHLALGILGEIFLPDSIDIATAGFSYIPNRFRKAGKAGIKLWADITKARKGAEFKAAKVDWDKGLEFAAKAEGRPYDMKFLNEEGIVHAIRQDPDYIQKQLPIERFQSIPYKESVISKMTPFGGSMRKGVMDIKAIDSVKLGDKKQRAMLEAYLSPDRIAGSFDGFGKANRPGFAEKWADFLKAKGLDPVGDVQIHHINPLYDSIHLFDGVKFDSKEYWDTIEALIQGNARTGVINRGEDVNNLMMTLGKGKAVDTPHGIAHKYLNAQTPTFFNKAEMKLMKADPAYRLQKAEKWAEIVNKSEEIILEAHKQWSLLNPKTASKLSFDEIVDTLSKYTDQGYSNLLSSEYQLPDFNKIITQIAKDKGLKGPIFRLQPRPVRDPSKVTQLEKMTKEADIINELKSINRTPKPVNKDQMNLGL